jgi:ABC-type transporter Mla subunit MlaD
MVGGFMVLGLVALSWLMTSFGELPAFLGGKQYEVKMAVTQPSGIGEGAPIYLSGVQIGRVTELKFKNPASVEEGVHIVGSIEEQYRIPRNATAVVQPAGFGIGRGHINIEVPEGVPGAPVPPNGELAGKMGSVFQGVIPDTLLITVEKAAAQLGNFVEELTPVAEDLHDLMTRATIEDVDRPEGDPRRLTANLYTVVQRVDGTLKAFNETLGDPEVRAGLIEIVENVKQMSIDGREAFARMNTLTQELRQDIQNLSDRLGKGLDDANQSIHDIVDALRPTLEHTAQLSAALVRISTALEQGKGTAGMLVNDPRLYEAMLLTMQRLTEMVDTIQRLTAKFEMDGEIKVNVPLGPFRHRAAIKVPDAEP